MIAEVPVLIPAYQPGPALVDAVTALVEAGAPVIVVDDGSDAASADFFTAVSQLPRVHLVRHAVNLGKGAALKTGINYALCQFPSCLGVVTADADGQHAPSDILRVLHRLEAQPDSLVLGVRRFQGNVPARSRIGNDLTRKAVRLLIGQKLSDTQTGLRGIPQRLLSHLLRMSSSGYEFELDMLIACKHQACPIVEEEIQTIYLDGNQSSHFSPIADSMRIYFLLLRFGALSALTALVDNLCFLVIFGVTGRVATAQVCGRLVGMTVNYLGARSVVFHSQQKHRVVLPKYVLLVCVSGLVSYGLLTFLRATFGWNVMAAKLAAEGILFVANFTIQRDLVFTKRRVRPVATDWDSYYQSSGSTAEPAPRQTTYLLLSVIKKFLGDRCPKAELLELGGANSRFFDSIMTEIRPQRYMAVDTSEYGLSLLEQRAAGDRRVETCQRNVLALSLEARADLVFSVGLIEHFDVSATRRAILAHFDAVRPGGYVVLAFQTPAFFYRLRRGVSESLGFWKLHDERPLVPGEVLSAMRERGDIMFEKKMRPPLRTQYLIVARRFAEPQDAAPHSTASGRHAHVA